jgi:NADH:ubiquinone oxidoreductase subunit D
VSPGGKLQNRSDVYKRALVKLDEMRENGKLSEEDYDNAKRALTEVAINTAN